MIGSRRYRIRRSPWWSPLLVIFGATDARSYVEIAGASLDTRFGWHTARVPLTSIISAERSHWPWYGGIGWRSNLRSTLGLIGSHDGVVRLRVDPPARTRLLGIPFRMRDLYISLEDPSGFLAALSAGGVATGRAG
jgi:hypothetical protein